MENKAHEIRMVKIEEIRENKRNPNRHDDEGIARLKKNIREIGFRSPLVVSSRSGELIAGHGRLRAARELQMGEVPVIFQDFKDEAEEYAHMTADNALASWSELDFKQINADIQDLGPFDIELLGIEDFQVDPSESNQEIFSNLFDSELDEKNDYLVFVFNSREDFLKVCDRFGVQKQVECLSKRKNHKMLVSGTGRILNGDSLLNEDV